MSSSLPRICVSSSFPEHLNRNLTIAGSMAEGFAEVLGARNVRLAANSTLLTVVEEFRPDLVLLVGSSLPALVNYEEVRHVTRKIGSVLGFWSVEDPYEIDASFKFTRFADVVFTNEMSATVFYDHPNAHHLPTAANPRTHWRPLRPSALKHLDVFFCGVGYRVRQRLLLDAAETLSRRRTLIAGANWPTLPFARNARIPPARLCDLYADAKVVLNLGRDFNLANARFSLAATTPGPRTYEAAMAGAVQLYHLASRAVDSDFTIGEEILTFETVAELDETIAWVIDHPDDADAVAARAQQRALRDHTYANRAQTVLKTIGFAGDVMRGFGKGADVACVQS